MRHVLPLAVSGLATMASVWILVGFTAGPAGMALGAAVLLSAVAPVAVVLLRRRMALTSPRSTASLQRDEPSRWSLTWLGPVVFIAFGGLFADALDAGLDEYPNSAILMAHKGWMLITVGRSLNVVDVVAEGERLIERALSIDGDDATARYFSAVARMGDGAPVSAVAEDLRFVPENAPLKRIRLSARELLESSQEQG